MSEAWLTADSGQREPTRLPRSQSS